MFVEPAILGPRPVGRPPKPKEEHAKRQSFTLDKATLEHLREIADQDEEQNMSAVLRRLIRREYQRLKREK